MKLIGAAIGVAAMCAATVGAQSSTTTQTETKKTEVKGGRVIKLVGCLATRPGGGYLLTSSSGDLRYVLVTDRNLSKRVGELVEVRGRAADQGDGKVKFESKVGTSGRDTSETKTEVREDSNLHYLGLKSVKRLSTSCH